VSYWLDRYLNDHNDGDVNGIGGIGGLSRDGGDYTGGMFAFLDGPRPSQPVPCYDEDLAAMGAPKGCREFSAAGMCDRQVSGDGAVVADYCPAACGRCVPSYTPAAVAAVAATLQEDDDGEGKEERAASAQAAEAAEAALDFQFADVDAGPAGALQEGQTVHLVEPAAGRLVMFSSGRENVHQVRPVRRGTRYVMSMWFTCSADRFFPDFLDGACAFCVLRLSCARRCVADSRILLLLR
jgi:hypothetical protein